MEEVTQQARDEARRAFQVSVQIARFFAAQRRRQLERERQESLAQEEAVQRIIERERELADPVIRKGLVDDRFWRSAQPTDAAYVYGIAVRFQDNDLLARMTADRCRREALERWDIDLTTPARPVGPDEVDDATLNAVAPVLEDEKDRDLGQDLADSARAPAATASTSRRTLSGSQDARAVKRTAAPASVAPWDSPQARRAWADGQVARGHDPAVVRAALAGDQALHEPAHKATRPARGSSTPPVKPRRPRALTQKQRI